MAAKLPALNSHQRLNILQPKRFNTNHTVVSSGANNCSPLLNNDPLGNSASHLVSKESPVFSFGPAIFPLPLGNASPTPSAVTTRVRPPNTMAKRNARERNRVKQVNQGFQTLRQHIPDHYRLKKMSKVDTLRCALTYIRSMEKVLDIAFSPGALKTENDFDLEDDDFSPRSLSPGLNQSQLDSFCGGSGESGSDQSFVYGLNESIASTMSDHCQHSYVLELAAETNLMNHHNEENCHAHNGHGIPMDENFKQEVEDHFGNSREME